MFPQNLTSILYSPCKRTRNLFISLAYLTTRGFSGKSSIQGKHAGKYICMKKNTGQVVLKVTTVLVKLV